MLKKTDQNFTLNAYQHSDICLSALSSAMVEALFFNKYVINLICGKATVRGGEFNVKEYKLHHLEHLYGYGIINNVFSHKEMINKINLNQNTKNKNKDIEKFIINEASVFKGNSAKEYLKVF